MHDGLLCTTANAYIQVCVCTVCVCCVCVLCVLCVRAVCVCCVCVLCVAPKVETAVNISCMSVPAAAEVKKHHDVM